MKHSVSAILPFGEIASGGEGNLKTNAQEIRPVSIDLALEDTALRRALALLFYRLSC